MKEKFILIIRTDDPIAIQNCFTNAGAILNRFGGKITMNKNAIKKIEKYLNQEQMEEIQYSVEEI